MKKESKQTIAKENNTMMIRIFSSKYIVAVLALTTMTMCNNNVDAANETDTMDDSDVTLMCRSSSDECPARYPYTVTAGGPDLPKTGCCTTNDCLPAEVPVSFLCSLVF